MVNIPHTRRRGIMGSATGMTVLMILLNVMIMMMVVMMHVMHMMITRACMITATNRQGHWVHAIVAGSNNRMHCVGTIIHNTGNGMLMVVLQGTLIMMRIT